jgi:hypothetical protein
MDFFTFEQARDKLFSELENQFDIELTKEEKEDLTKHLRHAKEIVSYVPYPWESVPKLVEEPDNPLPDGNQYTECEISNARELYLLGIAGYENLLAISKGKKVQLFQMLRVLRMNGGKNET